ncbi:MAG: hypothetical protein ACI31I_05650 [Bacilli bacterium]|nr:hypothetical protein [Bacilli bacterium]
MNKLFLSGLLILTTSYGALEVNNNDFIYQYQIIGNSKKSADVLELYYIKERVIDTYESFFINIEPSLISSAIKEKIYLFKFKENIQAYYKNGIILLIIEQGNGLSLKGSLRTSMCDETVIREKFFILDLFEDN